MMMRYFSAFVFMPYVSRWLSKFQMYQASNTPERPDLTEAKWNKPRNEPPEHNLCAEKFIDLRSTNQSRTCKRPSRSFWAEKFRIRVPKLFFFKSEFCNALQPWNRFCQAWQKERSIRRRCLQASKKNGGNLTMGDDWSTFQHFFNVPRFSLFLLFLLLDVPCCLDFALVCFTDSAKAKAGEILNFFRGRLELTRLDTLSFGIGKLHEVVWNAAKLQISFLCSLSFAEISGRCRCWLLWCWWSGLRQNLGRLENLREIWKAFRKAFRRFPFRRKPRFSWRFPLFLAQFATEKMASRRWSEQREIKLKVWRKLKKAKV